MNHNLSIWLEMEFTSDIFLNHQLALIIHKYFLITTKIICFITKSLRKSFSEDNFFLLVGLLKFVVRIKTWFLDLHQVKVICYRRYLLLYSTKKHYWIIWANCCVKKLEMIKKQNKKKIYISQYVRKIHKTFGHNKVLVCLEASLWRL